MKVFEPVGTRFSGMFRGKRREMILVNEGHAKGWICYRHPDGQWVTLRKATDADQHELAQALSAALHDGHSLIS